MPRPLLVILSVVLLHASLVTLAQPAQAVASTATCASTVVIAARGTGEPSGYGRTWPVVKKVRDTFSRSVRTDYLTAGEYPATGANYPWSVAKGEGSLRAKLGRLVQKCPGTRIVLVGYSQGAHVIGDVIDTRGTQLSSAVRDRVKAVVLLGDPTFLANQNYSAGTYDRRYSGTFKRKPGAFGLYAGRVRSYCNRDDRWCQNNWGGGAAANAAHADYAKYTDAAYAFVRGRY